MSMHFLYKLTFPSGKIYIGMTGNLKARLKAHEQSAHTGSSLYVHVAIRKYGMKSVICETLCSGPRHEIAQAEIDTIRSHKSTDREIGYNLSPGGDISPMLIQESRDKMRASMLIRFQNPAIRQANRDAQKIAQNRPEVLALKSQRVYGPHSDETKAKMSASGKGKKQSAEHIKKRSSTQVGAKRSDESKARMSAGQKARLRTPEELERMRSMAKGRVVSEEHRRKLSDAAKARWARTRATAI